MFQPAIALGCIGEAKEIATKAIFLASDASSYVTGTTIVVDGGFHIQWTIRWRKIVFRGLDFNITIGLQPRRQLETNIGQLLRPLAAKKGKWKNISM